MEIVRTERGGYLELSIEGRLDGYWAQHLATSVGDVIRQGTHAVRLNLAKTNYISSAGIGVLVDLHKQFRAVKGSLLVTEPSPAVHRVLQMVGLAEMLIGSADAGGPAPSSLGLRFLQAGNAVFEIRDLAPDAQLTCRPVGEPARLAQAGYTSADCHPVAAADDCMALGLGAFGDGFEGNGDRFGEFLTVSGAAACQPTDGTNFPDYMLGSGAFVPGLTVLYALRCQGQFAKLVRFEGSSGDDPVPLSLIVETCLKVSGAPAAGIAIMAESAGLMGAALKRSPVRSAELFAYPEIRQWLSFSPERCFPHALALIVGVAAGTTPDALRPFVRPLATGSKVAGHFHAAAFGYRPLQKGRIDLNQTVRGLFEAGALQSVLHLLADDRELGGGESELMRGACWVSPLAQEPL